MTRVDEDEVHNLFVGKEAYFHLSRFVIKQNIQYWKSEKPTN
jgi:hypothetical protein